jgi:hypothetical protein
MSDAGLFAAEPNPAAAPPAVSTQLSQPSLRAKLIGVAVVVLLAVVHAAVAMYAASTKSPTYDEPVHAFSAFVITHEHDFRVNPEHPPLWKLIAGLGTLNTPFAVDMHGERAVGTLKSIERQWDFSLVTSYDTPSNDGLRLAADARRPMAIVGGLMVLATGLFALAVRGPIAAVVAAMLVGLDPNLLGHAGLVTNDVPMTLATVLIVWAAWRLGERITPARVAMLGLAMTLAAGMKFTAVVIIAAAVLLLAMRAARSQPWPVSFRRRAADRTLTTFGGRFAAAAAVTVACGLIVYAGVWAMYGFRHGPTPVPAAKFDFVPYLKFIHARNVADEATVKSAENNPSFVMPDLGLPSSVWALAWIDEHKLLPQAYTFGLAYAKLRSEARNAFLFGEVGGGGWWWYFPAAVLVKAPVSTTAAVLAAVGVGVVWLFRKDRRPDDRGRWLWMCLLVPGVVLLATAMRSNLNIGVRHVFPIFPLTAVAVALVADRAIRTGPAARWATVSLASVLGLGLLVETATAYPNYIAFFSPAYGGPEGGFAMLSDSNLDWGQDLPALGEWIKRPENRGKRLYVSYFGTVPPHLYVGPYTNIPPGYTYGRKAVPPDRPGVIAVSATQLQGTYAGSFGDAMRQLRRTPRLDVLNGTIYLYEFPLRKPEPDGGIRLPGE